MKTVTPTAVLGKETELKLALPTHDVSGLVRRLARAAVLNRRRPTQQRLHNVYFDTPDQHLRQQEVALRIRRVDGTVATHWLQTLKSGTRGNSALSHRGEWESSVAGPTLERDALDLVTWSHVDPHGDVFAALTPCFVTDFMRTIWTVRRRDGSVVEVALDIGSVSGGERTTPICELELELKGGPVSALFDIALQIAGSVPVLPLAMSKAQRGYALAADAVDAPVKADPPRIKARMSLNDTARIVLGEMFGQFSANLNALRHCDDPEVVHQARVAWRRFKSARRLFKPVLATTHAPDWQALAPLLDFLGDLRDLDVALGQVLPPLRDDYVAQSSERHPAWAEMLRALATAAAVQRSAVRYALEDPAVGACLLLTTQWLEHMAAPGDADGAGDEAADGGQPALRRWANRRTTRLHTHLMQAHEHANDPQSLHEVRILAKRTRYSIDALQGVLPHHMVRKWYRQAADMQQQIGADRDIEQAIMLLGQLDAPNDIVAFLRGVAAGRRST